MAAAYPGRGAARRSGGSGWRASAQTILAPPGGNPAALTNLPGRGGALARRRQRGRVRARRAARPGGDLHHRAVADPVAVVGSGRVELEVTASAESATLFVSLWDLGPDIESTAAAEHAPVPSSAVLPHRAVAPVRLSGLTPGRPTPVTVALPAVAHQVPVEHRLQVVVATTDQAYALPDAVGRLHGRAGRRPVLVLPDVTLRCWARDDLNVPVPLIVAVSLLALAALVGVVWLWRRNRAAHPDPGPGRRPARGHRRGEDLRRRVPGGGRDLVPRRARPGGRAAGAERGRQDHGHPDAGRADPAGLRPDLRPRRAGARAGPTCWPRWGP